jgi:hypothetical protein
MMSATRWGWKRINIDGTTRGGFRWPVGVGGEVTQEGPADKWTCWPDGFDPASRGVIVR